MRKLLILTALLCLNFHFPTREKSLGRSKERWGNSILIWRLVCLGYDGGAESPYWSWSMDNCWRKALPRTIDFVIALKIKTAPEFLVFMEGLTINCGVLGFVAGLGSLIFNYRRKPLVNFGDSRGPAYSTDRDRTKVNIQFLVLANDGSTIRWKISRLKNMR